VLAGAGVFAAYYFFFSEKSPEDQIKALIQKREAELNGTDASYDPALVCKQYVADDEKSLKQIHKGKSKIGKITFTVSNIHVTGNSATGDVTLKSDKMPVLDRTDTSKFIKEDGKWKQCDPPSSGDDDDDSGGN
jgi:hypothetical protein